MQFSTQPALGEAPSNWVKKMGLQNVPNVSRLPSTPLRRDAIRKICTDPNQDVLFGYICVMAWGGQNAGPQGKRHAVMAWKNHSFIELKLRALRSNTYDRCQAYNTFRTAPIIPGLGPSFFTKLLYFFSPTPDFYIMDQWTGRSVNLLTGEHIVRFDGSSPSSSNKGGNYQAFCEEIDELAKLLKLTGEETEQLLYDGGNRAAVGTWRDYVRSNCIYAHHRMCSRYGHISSRDL